MKLLLENWRKLLEGDVVDLPTGATVADRYASYIRHLDMALEELQSISDIFEIKGHTVEDIEIMIQKHPGKNFIIPHLTSRWLDLWLLRHLAYYCGRTYLNSSNQRPAYFQVHVTTYPPRKIHDLPAACIGPQKSIWSF